MFDQYHSYSFKTLLNILLTLQYVCTIDMRCAWQAYARLARLALIFLLILVPFFSLPETKKPVIRSDRARLGPVLACVARCRGAKCADCKRIASMG